MHLTDNKTHWFIGDSEMKVVTTPRLLYVKLVVMMMMISRVLHSVNCIIHSNSKRRYGDDARCGAC